MFTRCYSFGRAALLAARTQTSLSCKRSLASRPLGSNPLSILHQECMARQLCSQDGNRLPGVHWVCAIAVANSNTTMPPNLRTVGVQRVTSDGVDFILKAKSPTAQQLIGGQGIAFLHTQGHFLPGESAEQWRGEGTCTPLPLDELFAILPQHTLTSMVGSTRLEKELSVSGNQQQDQRSHIGSKSHITEIMQQTRTELENGNVSADELAECVQAFRFRPDRLECMYGGPDSVMWDRWEWNRDETASSQWTDAKNLVPH